MIRADDAQFHDPDANEPTWGETNFFGFYSAQAPLNVGVYALFRTSLKVVSSTICINSRRVVTPWEAEFCDCRSAMPIPQPMDLRNYRLLNGLAVKCTKPNMDWDIKYDDGQGTTVDVRYESLMPPFDIHDPEMDPMCASKTDAGKFAWGTAYNGHFDQTGRVRGQVVVRGKPYAIDCVSTMDHSWGPRPERGAPNMSWLHAHFSEDLAIHGIFSFDPQTNGTTLSLAHGYVLEKGKVFGLKRGRGQVARQPERYAQRVELELTDSTDRVWRPKAHGLTAFPWQCWPNMVAFNVLGKWECGRLEGYGEIMDFFELPQLNALNGEPKTHVASLP